VICFYCIIILLLRKPIKFYDCGVSPVPPAPLLPIATRVNFTETDATGARQPEMGTK